MVGMDDDGPAASETTAEHEPGGGAVVSADVIGTVLIAAAGALGLVSEALAKSLLVPVSSVAASVGVIAFVWSYFHAVGRSREHEISVSQLYVVAGTVAPPGVKRRLQWSLYAQVVVAVAVTSVGFSQTEPQQFNWAAVIIVVPLYGMGLSGVWVSRYGTFGPRILASRPTRRRRAGSPGTTPAGWSDATRPKKVMESHDAADAMKQNDRHG